MQQLEKRFYERSEIAEILDIDAKSQNFKRSARNKLTNWGYSFSEVKKGFRITRAPETAQERLSELMIRIFDIDVQVDVYAFACFINLFSCYEEFSTMPWDERVKDMKKLCNVDIAASTLKKWYQKLDKLNLVSRDKTDKAYWQTSRVDGVKLRRMVDGNEHLDKEMKEYFAHRKELITNHISSALASGEKNYKKITAEAWEEAQKILWSTYQCCYYSCGKISLNIIGECAQEIFELVEEISKSEFTEYEVVVSTRIVPVVPKSDNALYQKDTTGSTQNIQEILQTNTNNNTESAAELPPPSGFAAQKKKSLEELRLEAQLAMDKANGVKEEFVF